MNIEYWIVEQYYRRLSSGANIIVLPLTSYMNVASKIENLMLHNKDAQSTKKSYNQTMA